MHMCNYNLFYFLCKVPSEAPTNLVASSITSTSAILVWSPPPLSGQNGVITGYNISLLEVDSENRWTYSSNTNSISLSSLMPYTDYSFALASRTIHGFGPFSNFIDFKTNQEGMLYKCFHYHYLK